MMPHEPIAYDASQINWLRPPDVEGETGAWESTWMLRLGDHGPAEGTSAADLLAALCDCSVEISRIDGGAVRLVVRTRDHPLEPAGFTTIDGVLRGLDAAFGGVAEINGSPREQWRMFRPPLA
jgi:hypothetical protein